MARRTKKIPYIVRLALLFLACAFAWLIWSRRWGGILFISGGTAATVFVIWVVIPYLRRSVLFQQVYSITDEHMEALVRQRTILIRTDPYGKPVLDKWNSEINYFIIHHVRPGLRPGQRSSFDRYRRSVAARIAAHVAEVAQQRPAFSSVPANMTGAEFEAFCADRLRDCGWEVRLTPLSHDQGVDVIAEKSGVRVALQCKLYAKPVGNSAVQEIAAGRVHQQAHYGAVVTNGTFTPSAKELSATNGIRLLHYSDLPQLGSMLRQPVP